MPKLGSAQDIVLRKFLVKESEKESIKTNLLSLLVLNGVSFNTQDAGKKWEDNIKRLWTSYQELEFHNKIAEHTDEELNLSKYYLEKVKILKPILNKTKQGGFVVSGLDSLKE